MNVELIRYTPEPDELCARAAGICVGRGGSTKGLMTAIRSGHESVIEHASFTFIVEDVSRVLLAQLTRHRLASYDVQSQRYVHMAGIEPIIPESVMNSGYYGDFLWLVDEAMDLYKKMVNDGIPREDARYITPQAMPTSLVMTMNARELRHFFQLRCCNRAQKEIRDLADEMFRQCRKVAPILFGECGPACMTGGCKETRPCGHPRTMEEILG